MLEILGMKLNINIGICLLDKQKTLLININEICLEILYDSSYYSLIAVVRVKFSDEVCNFHQIT